MDRLLRKALVLAVAGLLVGSVAEAIVPDPALSTVPECVPVAPNAGLTYQVVIVGTGGPINASRVELRFTNVADTLICWCDPRPTPRPPSFFANTNVSGVAVFNIAAGGCIENGLGAIPGTRDFAGEVFADGVKMQEFGIVSPDAVDGSGRMATSTPVWDPAGTCIVGLSDAVQHTTPLATSTYEWCTDINCDAACGLPDAVILTPFLAGSTQCPGNAGP